MMSSVLVDACIFAGRGKVVVTGDGLGGFSTGGVGATGLFFFRITGFGLSGGSSVRLFTDWLRFNTVSVRGSNLKFKEKLISIILSYL